MTTAAAYMRCSGSLAVSFQFSGNLRQKNYIEALLAEGLANV